MYDKSGIDSLSIFLTNLQKVFNTADLKEIEKVHILRHKFHLSQMSSVIAEVVRC